MASAGVQKPQAQNLPVLVGSLVLRAPSVVCGMWYVVKLGAQYLFISVVSLSVSAQLFL